MTGPTIGTAGVLVTLDTSVLDKDIVVVKAKLETAFDNITARVTPRLTVGAKKLLQAELNKFTPPLHVDVRPNLVGPKAAGGRRRSVRNHLQDQLKDLKPSLRVDVTPQISKDANLQDSIDDLFGKIDAVKIKVSPDIDQKAIQKSVAEASGATQLLPAQQFDLESLQEQAKILREIKSIRTTIFDDAIKQQTLAKKAIDTSKAEAEHESRIQETLNKKSLQRSRDFDLRVKETKEQERQIANNQKIIDQIVKQGKERRKQLDKRDDEVQKILDSENKLLDLQEKFKKDLADIFDVEKDRVKISGTLLERIKQYGEIQVGNLERAAEQNRLLDARRRKQERLNNATFNEFQVVRNIVASFLRIDSLKKGQINRVLGDAIAGELLLRQLNNVFTSAIKVRKAALQMGTAFAVAFAIGAQAAGGFLSAIGNIVTGLEILSGLGIVAVGIRLQLEDEEVQAARDDLVDTFQEVGTRASESLKPFLTDFFGDLEESIEFLEPTFTKFFEGVTPGLENLGKAFNEVLRSDTFARLVGKAESATRKFLDGFAERLPGIVEGIDRIGEALKNARDLISRAFGPSVFDRFSIDGFIAGLETLVSTLLAAAPGVVAFKEAFGEFATGVRQALESVAVTIGEFGPQLFGSLGPIAQTFAQAAGEIGSAFIELAAGVLPRIEAATTRFFSAFGGEFANSIRLLEEPLSRVINGVLDLGTALSPLLTTISNILINLDPAAAAFLNLLTTLAPLAVAIGDLVEGLSSGFGPTLTVIINLVNLLATALTPVITVIEALANSALAPLIGVIAAVAVTVGVAKTAFGALSLAVGNFAAKSKVAQAAGSTLNTVFRNLSIENTKLAGKFRVVSAATLKTKADMLTTAATATSAQARTAAAISRTTTATRAQAISARAATVALRGQAIALRTAAVAARAGAVAARGLGAAFRFMLGPIGLLLIGIEILIGGFEGFVRIGKAVAPILVGIGQALSGNLVGAFKTFKNLDFGDIANEVTEGAKEVGRGVKEHFTGAGEDAALGLGEGFDSGLNRSDLKGKLEGIQVDLAASVSGTGQKISEALAQDLGQVDLGEQINALRGLDSFGPELVRRMQEGTISADAVGNILAALDLDALAERVRQGGTFTAEELSNAITETIGAKKGEIKAAQLDALSTGDLAEAIGIQGVQGGNTLMDSSIRAIEARTGAVKAKTKEALTPEQEQVATVGNDAGKTIVDQAVLALGEQGPRIQEAFNRAFTFAIGDFTANQLPNLVRNGITKGVQQGTSGIAPVIQNQINTAFADGFSFLEVRVRLGVAFAMQGGLISAITGVRSIADQLAKLPDAAQSAVVPLQQIMQVTVKTAMTLATNEARFGADDIVQEIANAATAIENLSGRFYQAGSAIGRALANGINDSTRIFVQPAANNMAKVAGATTPNSPAEEGPLSGHGDMFFRGQRIAEGLARGILESLPGIKEVVEKAAAIVGKISESADTSGGLTEEQEKELEDFLRKAATRARGRVGFSSPATGSGLGGGTLTGPTSGFTGSILQRDSEASLSSTSTSSRRIEIRPGVININAREVDPFNLLQALGNEITSKVVRR